MDKTLTITKVKLAYFAAAFAVAFLFPFFGNQFITGPIVNAVLFIATVLLGVEYAIFIGLFPSLVSLSVGLLPAVLAPVVPFIMISNALLVLVFNLFKDKLIQGIIIASILKFLFLLSTTSLMTSLVIKKELASKIVMMMNWPQLLTALIGGLIAYSFLKIFKYNRQ